MTVFCEKKVKVHMAFAAQPEMFHFNLARMPVSGPNHSAIAKIVELLAARRIHTLGNHVRPLGYRGKCTLVRLPP